MIIFATWFSIIGVSAPSTSPSSTSKSHESGGVHFHITTDLISTIGLVIATIVFIISSLFLRWSEPITIDHVVFVLTIWVVLGVAFKYVCICCEGGTIPTKVVPETTIQQQQQQQQQTNGTDYDVSQGTAVPPPDQFVVEWEGTVLFSFDSMCSSVAVILVYLLNSVFVALNVMLYVVVYLDQDIFRFFRRNETTKKWIARKESIVKVIGVTLYVMGIFVPFACSNASVISKETFFWKITLFSIVWLLRKTNSYNRMYFTELIFKACWAKSNKYEGAVDVYKTYFNFVHKPENFESMYMRPQMDPRLSVMVDKQSILKIRKTMIDTRVLDNAVDWTVTSLVLFVCGWFTVVGVAQAIFEFIMLYVNTKEYNRIMSGFQYEFKQLGSAIIFDITSD